MRRWWLLLLPLLMGVDYAHMDDTTKSWLGVIAECNAVTGKLNWDAAAEAFKCDTDQAGGAGVWTQTGAVLHPTTATDDVANDATGTNWRMTDSGALTLDGSITAGGLVQSNGNIVITNGTFASVLRMYEPSGSGGDSFSLNVDPLATDTDWFLPSGLASAGEQLTDVAGNGVLSWEAAGSVADGDKGDITVSASGATWNIDPYLDSKWWGSNEWSLLSGTQCANAGRVTGIGGAGGPSMFLSVCAMAGAEADGAFVFGMTMPDGWDAGTVTLEVTAILDTDSGAGTFYGAVSAQCAGHQDTVSTSWGAEVALDLVEDAGDVVWDQLMVTSAAVTPSGSCATGDTLYIKYRLCDTDTTPTAPCGNSTTTMFTDVSFLGAKLEYNVTSGD